MHTNCRWVTREYGIERWQDERGWWSGRKRMLDSWKRFICRMSEVLDMTSYNMQFGISSRTRTWRSWRVGPLGSGIYYIRSWPRAPWHCPWICLLLPDRLVDEGNAPSSSILVQSQVSRSDSWDVFRTSWCCSYGDILQGRSSGKKMKDPVLSVLFSFRAVLTWIRG